MFWSNQFFSLYLRCHTGIALICYSQTAERTALRLQKIIDDILCEWFAKKIKIVHGDKNAGPWLNQADN